MVIIGYNKDNYPVSILSTKSVELAYAYWQGAKTEVNSHKVLEEDFTPLSEHPTGVFPILKTILVDTGTLRNNSKVIMVSR